MTEMKAENNLKGLFQFKSQKTVASLRLRHVLVSFDWGLFPFIFIFLLVSFVMNDSLTSILLGDL